MVFPPEEAVIACENHDGAVGHAKLVEPVEKPSDLVVERCDHAGVVPVQPIRPTDQALKQVPPRDEHERVVLRRKRGLPGRIQMGKVGRGPPRMVNRLVRQDHGMVIPLFFISSKIL